MFERLFASRNRPCFASSRRWEPLVYDFSGNRFEITLPPPDYEFPEDWKPGRFNIFDPSFYEYNSEPDRSENPPHCKGVSSTRILRRNWNAYGSFWLSYRLGGLQCAVVVCDTSRMPYKLNCFNKEHMEKLVIHGLYYSAGPGGGTNEYDSPINWHIKELHGTEWIYCEFWNRKPEWMTNSPFTFGSHFTALMVAPLFADKYILLSFNAIGSQPPEPSNRLRFQRIEQIIPSIKLTLSPEAQKQSTEIQQRFPDANYSASRKPENWKYYERYIKKEGNVIFEGPYSPPPRLD